MKPELKTLESGITESLESGILRHGIRNPSVGIRNPQLAWIPLHGVKLSYFSRLTEVKSLAGL